MLGTQLFVDFSLCCKIEKLFLTEEATCVRCLQNAIETEGAQITGGLIPPSILAQCILVTVLSTGVSLPLFCDPLWITYPKIVPVPSYGFCGLSVLSLYVSSADRLSPQAPPAVGYPENLGVVSGSCVLTLGGPSRRLQTVLLSRSGLCAGAEAALASFRADAAGLCTRPCLPPWFVYPSLSPSLGTRL